MAEEQDAKSGEALDLGDIARSSRVLNGLASPDTNWNWSAVGVTLRSLLALRQLKALRTRLEDAQLHKFAHHLFAFFSPQAGTLAAMPSLEREIARCGCLLMELVGRDGAVVLNTLCLGFLRELVRLLSPETEEGPRLPRTPALNYFLFLGELSRTAHGQSLLHKSGLSHR